MTEGLDEEEMVLLAYGIVKLTLLSSIEMKVHNFVASRISTYLIINLD